MLSNLLFYLLLKSFNWIGVRAIYGPIKYLDLVGCKLGSIKASQGGTPDDYRSNAQLANGYRERFELIGAFDRADPSPELNQTLTHTGRQAGRQAGR